MGSVFSHLVFISIFGGANSLEPCIWENNELSSNFEVCVGQFLSSQYSHPKLYETFNKENQVYESFGSVVIQSGSIELFNGMASHKATV